MRLAEPTVPMLVTRAGCEHATSPAQPHTRTPEKWSAGTHGRSATPPKPRSRQSWWCCTRRPSSGISHGCSTTA